MKKILGVPYTVLKLVKYLSGVGGYRVQYGFCESYQYLGDAVLGAGD